jgi:apolipoprotein N-acyltransferase
MPEANNFLNNLAIFLSPSEAKEYFDKLFEKPVLIVSGARAQTEDGKYKSQVFMLDTKAGFIGLYEKRLLTPAGEFLPYSVKKIIQFFSDETADRFEKIREHRKGSEMASFTDFDSRFKVSVMVCSDVFSPDLAKDITEGGDIIAGLNSISIFQGSEVIAKQQLVAGQFRAAEQNKPLISSVNMGRSYAIDSKGNIAKESSNLGSDLLTGEVVFSGKNTWYNKIGSVPIIVLMALLSAIYILRKNK